MIIGKETRLLSKLKTVQRHPSSLEQLENLWLGRTCRTADFKDKYLKSRSYDNRKHETDPGAKHDVFLLKDPTLQFGFHKLHEQHPWLNIGASCCEKRPAATFARHCPPAFALCRVLSSRGLVNFLKPRKRNWT